MSAARDLVVRRRPAQSEGDGPAPLVLLFHGRGSNETVMFEQIGDLPGRFAVASLRGPIALDGGGYTWFENRGLGRPVGESLRSTIDLLQAWLDGLDPAQYDLERLMLLGFSAGMLIAGALLLDRPSRFQAAVLLAGTLPWDNTAVVGLPGALTGKPVFYARGTEDDVIPMDLVHRSVSYLEDESGAQLTTHLYPIAHEISARERLDVYRWLEQLR